MDTTTGEIMIEESEALVPPPSANGASARRAELPASGRRAPRQAPSKAPTKVPPGREPEPEEEESEDDKKPF